MGSSLSTTAPEQEEVQQVEQEQERQQQWQAPIQPEQTAASQPQGPGLQSQILHQQTPPAQALQQPVAARRSRRPPAQGQPSWAPTDHNFNDDDELNSSASQQPLEQAEPDPDISREGPLVLSTRVEYSALPTGQTQAIFGLVTVQATEVAAIASAPDADEERRPMDLVCVLDVSGSMGSNNKIGDLKEAVRFIIDESRPQDRLSIVTFNSHAQRKLKLRRMDRQGKDEATVETMRLTASGGTSIAAGLDMGLAVLEQRRQRNKVSAVLLLTDGQDHSSRAHLQTLTQRAAKAGCGLYAFGFGVDHDADFLREISEQARTPYTFIENTATVKAAFAGVVGGLSSIVAQRVELTLDCQATLKDVNTPFAVSRQGEKSATVTIPDVFAGERRDVLVELSIPADLQGTGEDGSMVLLQASARYQDLRSSRGVLVQTPAVQMRVQRVDEVQPEMEPDVEVSDQRDRVQVTRVLEQAAQCSDAGQFEQAQQLIREQRSKVSKRLSPVTEALSLELEDAEGRMKSRSSWQVGAAEVKDAFQMHKMQRCTNVFASASSSVTKKSKAMYMNSTQAAWTSKSSRG